MSILYIGIKHHVVAIEKNTGREIWRTKLEVGWPSTEFTTLASEEDRVYACANGRVFALDAFTGNILWKNELSGLGLDIACLCLKNTYSSETAIIGKRADHAKSST